MPEMSLGLVLKLVPELKKFKILFFDVVSEYMIFVKKICWVLCSWLIFC